MTDDRELWERSAQSWIDSLPRDLNRTVLLDPVLTEMVRALNPSSVLDIGCGEGRSLRLFAPAQAVQVGIDPTPGLLREGARTTPAASMIRASGEVLPIRSNSFDLAISVVALVDIPDFRAAIREGARVLKPGGHMLVANLTSMITSTPTAWVKGEDGRHLHVRVDDYFEERADRIGWAGIEIINYHRSMEAYMQAYLDAGLNLREFLEPRPSAQDVLAHPRMDTERRVPLFNVMLWQKPRS